jgi:hypothetical protein
MSTHRRVIPLDYFKLVWEHIRSQTIIDAHGCWMPKEGAGLKSRWHTYLFGPFGKAYAAHRVAFCVKHDRQVFGDLHILHTCHRGHQGCFNPDHLVEGTHKENMGHKVVAGTSKKPSLRKYPVAVVSAFKTYLNDNPYCSIKEAGDAHGILPKTAHEIARGGTYAEVAPAINPGVRRRCSTTDFTENEIQQLTYLVKHTREPIVKIAKAFGIGATTLRRLVPHPRRQG